MLGSIKKLVVLDRVTKKPLKYVENQLKEDMVTYQITIKEYKDP